MNSTSERMNDAFIDEINKFWLKHNLTLSALEDLTRLINAKPDTCGVLPTQKTQILKLVKKSDFIMPIYYTYCKECLEFVENRSARNDQKLCTICNHTLRPNETNYFVYFPIANQIAKSIKENWEFISKHSYDKENIADVWDGQIVNDNVKFYENTDAIVCPLTFNFDGASRFKSNKLSLHPIQLVQNILPPSIRYDRANIIIAGMYYGSEKPDCLQYFLPLIKELKHLSVHKIKIKIHSNDITVLPLLLQCVVDLPAKSHLQEITQYNGKKACTYCLHPGCNVGKKQIRYTKVIPGLIQLRTDNDTRNAMMNVHSTKNRIQGVKGVSCTVSIPRFDVINGFCFYYMHCVCLGVVPNMVQFWCSTKYSEKRHFLSNKKQLALNKRLLSLKPPREIKRKPRSLDDSSKANEWRAHLLFNLPMCLDNILPKTFIDHFMLLSSSIFILLKEKITATELHDCEIKLERFVSLYQQYYGQMNMTMNVHLLTHIVHCVKQCGPLWAQSAFAFESFNSVILNYVKGNTDVMCQITEKYILSRQIEQNARTLSDEPRIKLLGKSTDLFIDGQKFLGVFKRIEINRTIYTSTTYTKPKNSVDYFVRLKNNDIGAIRFFSKHANVINLSYYKYKEVMNINCEDNQFLEIERTSIIRGTHVDEISHKLVHIVINSKNFVTHFPNSFEKD